MLKDDMQDEIENMHFLLTKARREKSKKLKKDPLDLPRSTNTLALVSADRVRLVLKKLSPRLDAKHLEQLSKQELARDVGHACHMEVTSHVPSKVWVEFLAIMEKLHAMRQRPLDSLTYKPTVSTNAVLKPDYDTPGAGVYNKV